MGGEGGGASIVLLLIRCQLLLDRSEFFVLGPERCILCLNVVLVQEGPLDLALFNTDKDDAATEQEHT